MTHYKLTRFIFICCCMSIAVFIGVLWLAIKFNFIWYLFGGIAFTLLFVVCIMRGAKVWRARK